MAIPPDSVRGHLVLARPTNPWALLVARLLLWSALAALSALTPFCVADAPPWIWPFALVACLLMAWQTLDAIRRKGRDGAGRARA
ncbi:hypothetical protein ABZT17_00130 [Streptomyces sp. NPDC005648]|uniref:hypothetical protein n=1 Tax=Streptomyces sp. NPDC005648 TaxID=3157044 RepID=UPI00339F413B